VIQLQQGSYRRKTRDDIRSDDYILNCVEAALWAFYSSDSFEKGCVLAINLGLNCCAIAAIYGQLAGAYYGSHMIPTKWVAKLQQAEYLRGLINNFKNNLCV
jgi:ADP-ribosyl-[dinitrogen reductase] hydrolase